MNFEKVVESILFHEKCDLKDLYVGLRCHYDRIIKTPFRGGVSCMPNLRYVFRDVRINYLNIILINTYLLIFILFKLKYINNINFFNKQIKNHFLN